MTNVLKQQQITQELGKELGLDKILKEDPELLHRAHATALKLTAALIRTHTARDETAHRPPAEKDEVF